MPNYTVDLIESYVKDYVVNKQVGFLCYDYIVESSSVSSDLANKNGVSTRSVQVLSCIASKLKDLAVEYNIVEKSGSWYSYNGEKMGQGRENAKLFLKENPFIMEEVADLIRAELNIPTNEKEAMMSEE